MRWFGRSLLAAIPVALGVVVCVFLLLRIVPGDPARMILGEQATTASIDALRDQLGLNLPVGQQLWSYLVGVFTRADIGTSLVTDQPVLGLILSRVPVTLLLVGLAVVFTVLIAVPLALVAATHKDGPLDHVVRIFPTIGMAMPAFWVGLILILVFGVALRWLPVGGIGTSPDRPAAQPRPARPDGGPRHVAAADPVAARAAPRGAGRGLRRHPAGRPPRLGRHPRAGTCCATQPCPRCRCWA